MSSLPGGSVETLEGIKQQMQVYVLGVISI